MNKEERKLNLIEAILKIEDPVLLNKLEVVLGKSSPPIKKPSFSAFAGIWSAEEAATIEKAVEVGCEQIYKN